MPEPRLAAVRARSDRTGDERGAELHQVTGGRLEESRTGCGRQLVGRSRSQYGTGIVGGERLQTDAIRKVGFQAAESTFVEALAGEEKVHAEGPTEATHGHEQLREVGVLTQEFGEFVDDDERERVAARGRAAPRARAAW